MGNQLDFFEQAPQGTAPESRKKPDVVEPAQASKFIGSLASKLPPQIYLGTSSWAFPGWHQLVYRHDYKPNQLVQGGLHAYAQHPLFHSVGIDRSYYRPLTQQELAEYAAVVPDDFRFLNKAHEACTVPVFPLHPRYGRQRGQRNPYFLDPEYARHMVIEPIMSGLQYKAGPILFQFSPQDLELVGGVQQFIKRLHRFLAVLPSGPMYAVEIRNASLLTNDYKNALADTGVSHCINVYPDMPPPLLQYQRTMTSSLRALVMRWMLHPNYSYEQAKTRYAPFHQLVDEDPKNRQQLAQLCLQAMNDGKPGYVIVNNKAEGSSPLSIELLAKEIIAQASIYIN